MLEINRENIEDVMKDTLREVVPVGVDINELALALFEAINIVMKQYNRQDDASRIAAFFIVAPAVFKEKNIPVDGNEIKLFFNIKLKEEFGKNLDLSPHTDDPRLKSTFLKNFLDFDKRIDHFRKLPDRKKLIRALDISLDDLKVSPEERVKVFAAMQLMMEKVNRFDDAAFVASFLLATKLMVPELKDKTSNLNEMVRYNISFPLRFVLDTEAIKLLRWHLYDPLIENVKDLNEIAKELSTQEIIDQKSALARVVPVAQPAAKPMETAPGSAELQSSYMFKLLKNPTLNDLSMEELQLLCKVCLVRLLRIPKEPSFRQDKIHSDMGLWDDIHAHMMLMVHKARNAKKPPKMTDNELYLAAFVVAAKVQLADDIGEIIENLSDFLDENGLRDISSQEMSRLEREFLIAIGYDASYQPNEQTFAEMPTSKQSLTKMEHQQVASNKPKSPLATELTQKEREAIEQWEKEGGKVTVKNETSQKDYQTYPSIESDLSETTLLKYTEHTQKILLENAEEKNKQVVIERIDTIKNACENYLNSIKQDYHALFLKHYASDDESSKEKDNALKTKYEYFRNIYFVLADTNIPLSNKMQILEQKFNSARHEQVMTSLKTERGNPWTSVLRDILSWFTGYFRKAALGELFVKEISKHKKYSEITSGTNSQFLAESAEYLIKTSPKLKPPR